VPVSGDGEGGIGADDGADRLLLAAGSPDTDHSGCTHDADQIEAPKAATRQRLAAGKGELDLGPGARAPGGPLPTTSSRIGHLLDALAQGYWMLGSDGATSGDGVFRELVLARIIEPVSKPDSLRALEEAGC
jgi:hypothetical protein